MNQVVIGRCLSCMSLCIPLIELNSARKTPSSNAQLQLHDRTLSSELSYARQRTHANVKVLLHGYDSLYQKFLLAVTITLKAHSKYILYGIWMWNNT